MSESVTVYGIVKDVLPWLISIIVVLLQYIQRGKDEAEVERSKIIAETVRTLDKAMGRIDTVERDVARMVGHDSRLTTLESELREVFGRLDRHGDDIDSVNTRIDFVAKLIPPDHKARHGTGDAGG